MNSGATTSSHVSMLGIVKDHKTFSLTLKQPQSLFQNSRPGHHQHLNTPAVPGIACSCISTVSIYLHLLSGSGDKTMRLRQSPGPSERRTVREAGKLGIPVECSMDTHSIYLKGNGDSQCQLFLYIFFEFYVPHQNLSLRIKVQLANNSFLLASVINKPSLTI